MLRANRPRRFESFFQFTRMNLVRLTEVPRARLSLSASGSSHMRPPRAFVRLPHPRQTRALTPCFIYRKLARLAQYSVALRASETRLRSSLDHAGPTRHGY